MNTKFLLSLLIGFTTSLVANAQLWKPTPAPLSTRWAKEVSPTNALPEYPRPQMVRKEWQNLNGLWDYAVVSKTNQAAPTSYQDSILVFDAIEFSLSRVVKAQTSIKKIHIKPDSDTLKS